MYSLYYMQCDVCQRFNRKMITSKSELHPVPVKAPWYHIGIDFIGPISLASSKGNRYILTISDYFSKFVEAVALPTKNADGVSNALFKVNSCMAHNHAIWHDFTLSHT